MSKGLRLLVGFLMVLCNITEADAPLPLHNIEGNSGVFITSTAYLVNPPEEGKAVGLPILSAGIRNSDAIHTGLVGFAGERETTFEGSVIAFLTERLAFAAEYRKKADELAQLNTGGKHLNKAENDWWTIALAYVVNNHTTVSGGYANLGNVFNHREDNVWGVQLKYEF